MFCFLFNPVLYSTHLSWIIHEMKKKESSLPGGERVGVRVIIKSPPPLHPLPPGEGRFFSLFHE
jgi:hypothetical protein